MIILENHLESFPDCENVFALREPVKNYLADFVR